MKLSVKEMVLISLFTALTAIGAFLSIPVGNVPITLQSMFALLSGILLGPKLGSLSQLVYVLLGLSGVRIFAQFSGGLDSIVKPSFGFLIGFIFAAFVVGKMVYEMPIDFKRIFLATLAGTFIIYLFGIPYMYMILNNVMGKGLSFSAVIKTGCLIFLPGDMFKAILSALIGSKVLRRMRIAQL